MIGLILFLLVAWLLLWLFAHLAVGLGTVGTVVLVLLVLVLLSRDRRRVL